MWCVILIKFCAKICHLSPQVKFAKDLVDEGFDLASRGEKLMDLVFVIDDLEMHSALEQVHSTTRAITLERFRCALRVFDHRYRIFEKNYIEALIAVEKQSRTYLRLSVC